MTRVVKGGVWHDNEYSCVYVYIYVCVCVYVWVSVCDCGWGQGGDLMSSIFEVALECPEDLSLPILAQRPVSVKTCETEREGEGH